MIVFIGVEAGCRFINDDQLWVVDQGLCNVKMLVYIV